MDEKLKLLLTQRTFRDKKYSDVLRCCVVSHCFFYVITRPYGKHYIPTNVFVQSEETWLQNAQYSLGSGEFSALLSSLYVGRAKPGL